MAGIVREAIFVSPAGSTENMSLFSVSSSNKMAQDISSGVSLHLFASHSPIAIRYCH